jgi:hypothetical protein
MLAVDDMRTDLDRIAQERAAIEKRWERERAILEQEGVELQKLWDLEQQLWDQERAKTRKELAESLERQKKADLALQKRMRAGSRTEQAPERFIDRTGGMAERVVGPDLIKQFGKLRYRFTKISRNIEFEDPAIGVYTVVDALLENADYAMVVAIRPALSGEDLTHHIECLHKLRKYADARNDSQKFYGAFASSGIDAELKTAILKQGFYIIESSGEAVSIVPPSVKPAAF